MAKQPRKIAFTIPDELRGQLGDYCEEHTVNQSDALRIAVERLLKKKPTSGEKDRAKLAVGNPNVGELNRKPKK